MKNSHIEWTDHTFNPWEGCTKVSPGCAHCYAEARNSRFGGGTAPNWGKGAPRRRTSIQNWNQPLKWNREADLFLQCTSGCRFQSTEAGLEDFCPKCGDPQADTVRPRVFCASLADVGDMEVPIEWFADLLQLIFECQNLDWQLLTKRPETFRQRLMHAALYMAGYRDGQTSDNPTAKPMAGWEWVHDWAVEAKPPANVWMGTTVEDQARADERIPALLAIPARVRFLSCEPLLGPIEFSNVTRRSDCVAQLGSAALNGIDWVICGGESGHDARPMHPDWARSLRDQCAAVGVPFLFKQWGEWTPGENLTTQSGRLKCASYGVGTWDFYTQTDKQSENCHADDSPDVYHVGKKAAGRILDGVEHNAFPEVRS